MRKQKLFAVLLCAAMLVSMLPTVAQAETPIVAYISSDITVDTTWPEGDYYICSTDDNNEPIVASGVTLTIESGSNVYFGYRVNEPIPNTDEYPYSCLTVNGTLNATGVTFTTVPDAEGHTEWRDAGWMGIEARSADTLNPASLSLTNCIFENCCGAGTLNGVDSNGVGDGQTVNIAVSGCTFRNPVKKVADELYAAIYYNNGNHQAGEGTLSVLDSNFADYSHGVLVGGNSRDDIDVTISGCTFNNIGIMPVMIHSGRSAIVTGNTFNNIEDVRDGVANIFTDDEASNKDQTVTLTDNTFNGEATTTKYPIVVGANAKINEAVTTDASTFSATYPDAYRYIRFSGGIGSTSTTDPSVENAIWGYTGIPYLMTNDVKISGNGTHDDGICSSLIIKPDVTVNFASGVGLNIDGTLTAVGEAAKPITFQKMPGADWCFTLEADGSLEGPISLGYCNLVDLNSGINIKAPSTAVTPPAITIDNCTIQGVSYQTSLKGKDITVTDSSFTGLGVNLENSQNVTLTNCAITVTSGSLDGVIIENAENVTLQGCDITQSGACGADGVSIYYSRFVTLKNCLVAGFPDYGIQVKRNVYSTTETGSMLIDNCTVTNNGKTGVMYYHSGYYNEEYSAYIKNSIIADNGSALPEDQIKLDIICAADYQFTIPEGSISYSFIGRDDAPFVVVSDVERYSHPTLGTIYPIPETTYSNRISGPAYFADAANGDYHLQSTYGRWNGSTWVTTDGVTSNCINAGDPASQFVNEPEDNGGRVNLGRYGNTVEASKSSVSNPSMIYFIFLPDGKFNGYDAYSIEAQNGTTTRVATGGSYSFTVNVNGYHYKTASFAVKADDVTLTEVENVYTIENITDDKTITVEGIALIQPPTFTTQPQNLVVEAGEPASFSVAVEAEGYVPTYNWRVYKPGIGWEDTGDTDTQHDIASTTIAQSGWRYICYVYYPYGNTQYSVASNNVLLTVTDSGTQYTTSVSASPAVGGTVSGGGSVNAGTSVTVTATPNGSYRFVRWTEGGTQVSTSASYTFNTASNRTLVAVFESIPPYDPPTPPSPPPAPVTEINSGGSVTASNISRLIASDEALTVQGEDGAELVFDTEALEGIGEQASGSVQIEIADVSGEYVETHPDKLVFSLTVKSGDKTITDFGGSVAVSLPYELKEGEAAENVTVWHLTANGVLIEIPCTYDAATGLASFTVSHFSVYIVGVAGEWANPFDDVDEADWFYDEVRFIYENNLMVGTGEATFSPLASTSRGMIVTILWRLEGKPEATLPMTFTDVADGQWYYDAVAWAAEKAIVDGYDITRFGPEDDITREQMAKILIAYADYKGKNTSARNDLSAFTDTPSSWALQSVSWAVAEGLMQGKGGGILDPQGGAKRCECAAIFQRFQYIIAGM